MFDRQNAQSGLGITRAEMYFNPLPLILFLIVGVSAQFETTTGVLDGDDQTSDPIRIVDGGPLWNDHATTTETASKFHNRALNIYTTDRTRTNLNSPMEDNPRSSESDDEFRPGALQEFLESYAEKLKKNKQESEYDSDLEDENISDKTYDEESEPESASADEKSKSWDLLNLQRHDHPYEDKNGWVSLEPIPWSISKISKWQSAQKKKPYGEFIGERPWDNSRPWNDRYEESYENQQRPLYSPYKKPYETHSMVSAYNPYKFSDRIGIRDDNDVYYIKKPNNRPSPMSAMFTKYNSQKLEVQTPEYMGYPDRNSVQTQRPYGMMNNYKHGYNDNERDCDHKHNGDIITDGTSPNFPNSHEFSRRTGMGMHPDTHPFNGDGEWVLLSTTKGYKFNPSSSRQRSLKVDPNSVGAHRSVRLTVLPPLKNSNINMTTSHGGLLQVESTFQTVEQAHREYTRKQKKKQKRKKRPQKMKPNKQVTNIRGTRAKKPTTATTNNNNNKNNIKNNKNNKNKYTQQNSNKYSNNSNNNNKNKYNSNRYKRPQKQITSATAITANRRNSGVTDTSAVLAAVGAGMIPATMAMLVPIALNGKRRKREVNFLTVRPPISIETTLQNRI